MKISTEWLGLIDYEDAFALQLAKSDQVRGQKEIHLLGLEHPAVVTFGKRANSQSDLPWGAELLKQNQISLVEADRGGQATLHSPGQLVIYPIVPLAEWGFGVRTYVRFLEEVTQDAFAAVGLSTELREGDPGVFTENGKIGFCGIRVDRGVSRHGLSLNISNDLNLFQFIRPCGALARPLDRLQDYQQATPEDFFQLWQQSFMKFLKARRSAVQVEQESLRI